LDFMQYLKNNPFVIFDGAMGTQLAKRGLEMGDANNIKNPRQVLEIHREYIDSGADALITNTLTMNRIYLESHGIDVDIRGVNLAGAELARRAAGSSRFVFGDIGPTGKLLQPYGDYTEEQLYENFREQAEILAEGCVDGFIIETMMDLREAVCALKACKSVADLPVIVSLSYSTTTQGGRTVMGNTVAEVAQALAQNGADAIGSNCGELDPDEMAILTAVYRESTDLPIIMEPNAGKPKLLNNQAVFDMEPGEFADGLMKSIGHGAKIVGGCCGTGPAHIYAIAKRLKKC
jgi:5-methyltetrahydrofolate--homocysteine methyltransferase